MRLQNNANQMKDEEPETRINDYIEIKRRIDLFTYKWDKILWIKKYVEDYDKEPDKEEVAKEQELSESVAEVYLQYYHDIDRHKKKDLDELLLDFNVYEDAVIWWFKVIQLLKTYPSKSLWLIFEKVAEYTPGTVAIALLEEYKYDLT